MNILRNLGSSIRDRGQKYENPENCTNEHAPASRLQMLACPLCNTFKWNGVDMCGKVCDVSPILVKLANGSYGPKVVHACTRKLGHAGDCKAERLTKADGTARRDYVPE